MSEPRSRTRFLEYRRTSGRHETGSGWDRDAGHAQPARHRTRTFAGLMAEFYGLLGGHRRAVVLALTTLTMATLLKLLPPAVTKLVIDYVLANKPFPITWFGAGATAGVLQDRIFLLWLLGGLGLVVALAATAIHLWGRWYATRTVNRLQVAIRKRVFEHAVRLPLDHVYRLKSGGAASVLREDAGGAAELVFSMLYNPWQAIVQLAGSLLILVWVDWRMLLGGLLLVPVVFVTHRTWIRRIRPLWRDVRRQREAIDAMTTETFAGMRVVRAFGRERTETNRFVRNNNLLIRQQLFVWWWSRIVDVVWDTLIPAASTVLLLYGGYRILQGSLTLGDLIMFLFYLAMLLGPLATLVTSAATFQNNLAGLDRVLDLLEQPLEALPTADAIRVSRDQVQGRITFRGVWFQYPETHTWALRELDLDVAAGEIIAIVGRSGAGKTTLCNLVARFYDPTKGQIQLDGKDLRTIHGGSHRRLLGIVEQEVFLFDGTVADNIGYGRRGAARCDIEQAARAAHASEFIQRLDAGFDAVIGERGVKLSGGQRQRLAIARAFLADPKILILDEATSNLDSESERYIQDSLRRLMHGRTCFVIAHRLSTIQLAGRVIVLDAGRLLAAGSHRQLLETHELYRRMVQLQDIRGKREQLQLSRGQNAP